MCVKVAKGKWGGVGVHKLFCHITGWGMGREWEKLGKISGKRGGGGRKSFGDSDSNKFLNFGELK